MTRPITFIDESDPLGPPADASVDTPLSAANLNAMQDGLLATLPTTGTHAARLAATATAGLLWKETDTGLIYLGAGGSTWTIWKGDGHVRKTADETVNNSATLQNDDHLKFPIEANEVWFVEAVLLLNAASANADFKIAWTGPASATATWGLVTNRGEAVTGGAWLASATTTSAQNLVTLADPVSFGANNGTQGALTVGVFTAAATAGTIQFQWAQNSATAENSKVLTNSLLRIRRLA